MSYCPRPGTHLGVVSFSCTSGRSQRTPTKWGEDSLAQGIVMRRLMHIDVEVVDIEFGMSIAIHDQQPEPCQYIEAVVDKRNGY